jgi:hypothetical protein
VLHELRTVEGEKLPEFHFFDVPQEAMDTQRDEVQKN